MSADKKVEADIVVSIRFQFNHFELSMWLNHKETRSTIPPVEALAWAHRLGIGEEQVKEAIRHLATEAEKTAKHHEDSADRAFAASERSLLYARTMREMADILAPEVTQET